MRFQIAGIILGLLTTSVAYTQVASTAQSPPGAAQQHQTRIDPLSVRSLLLICMSNHVAIATATGFIVEKNAHYYLVTNWHVLNGKRPDNMAVEDPLGRIPDEVVILHNAKGKLGQWKPVTEDLFDEQHRSRIIEHPLGRKVDIVFLPLTNTAEVDVYPTNLGLRKVSMNLIPTGTISIIGFPYGHASFAGLPIWKMGSIASDPDIDYDNTPQFLVDTTSRPGMSGSPVYERKTTGYMDENGNTVFSNSIVDKFLGIYAGDIDDKSEVGRVWKASAIVEIYDALP